MTASTWSKSLKSEYYRIGEIVRPHGIRGDVKLEPSTDDLSRFRELKQAYLERGTSVSPVALSHVRLLPAAVVLHIEGVETPEQAEQLRGAFLCVDRGHTVQLPDGSFFISDLIGCEVSDTEGKEYGPVTAVYRTKANDVYEIGNGKLMVPALRAVLHSVDPEANRIVLDAEVLREVGLFED